jgi:hypothetical protein
MSEPTMTGPHVLDYEPPIERARPLSRVALAALVVGIFSVLGVSLQTRAVIGVNPPVPARWNELAAPLLPLVDIGLSINAIFRISDPKERVSGNAMAWAALLLNVLTALPNVCCFGLRLMGNIR